MSTSHFSSDYLTEYNEDTQYHHICPLSSLWIVASLWKTVPPLHHMLINEQGLVFTSCRSTAFQPSHKATDHKTYHKQALLWIVSHVHYLTESNKDIQYHHLCLSPTLWIVATSWNSPQCILCQWSLVDLDPIDALPFVLRMVNPLIGAWVIKIEKSQQLIWCNMSS